jgi:hypothetical protein
LGLKFQPLKKVDRTADYFEKTVHAPWPTTKTMSGGWRLEFRFCSRRRAPKRIRSCDLNKLINFLKLRKACRIDGIPNKCFGQLPRRPLALLLIIAFSFHIFPCPGRKQKWSPYQNPVRSPKFLPHLDLCLISLLSMTDKLFEKVISKQTKGTSKKGACWMQVSLDFVHVTDIAISTTIGLWLQYS